MPIYEYQCECGRRYERIQRELIGRDICDCGELAAIVLSVPAIKTSRKSPDKPLGPSLGYTELILGE